jgi:4-amino-4-deoxy-L-arabinose transferase-like glycosyltransferase
VTLTDATGPATEPGTSPSVPQPPEPGGAGGTRTFSLWLAGICGVGLLVRFLNIFWWRPITNGNKALFDAQLGVHDARVGGDAFYYHFQANALAKGAWFVEPFGWAVLHGRETPSAAHPPLPVIYLALWSRLGLDSVNWHRVALSVMGVGTIAVIGLLGRRIGGNAVGLVAAGLAALYPQLWINDGMLLSETTAIFTVAVTLYVAYAFIAKPSVKLAALLGFTIALCAYSRTELGLLFVALALPLALLARDRPPRERAKLVAVSWVVGALVLAPWIVFNLARFDQPTFMTSGTGSALSAGNCDQTYYGKDIGYYAACFQGPWVKGDESERDIEPRRQAVDYMKDHARRLPLVVAARIGRLWGAFKPGQTTAFDWWLEGRGRVASWVGLFAYYVVVAFAVAGLVVMWRKRVSIIPLLSVIVVATISAAITFGVTRYRAPAEVALVVAAAFGIVAAWCRLRSLRQSSRSSVLTAQ